MHELSIAAALVDLVAQHAPPRTVLRKVVIEAGPLHGLDPDAMQWAWQSTTDGGAYAGAELLIQMLPWRMKCAVCGREWTAAEMESQCACGATDANPIGGDELRLMSLTVDEDEPANQEESDAGSGR